MESTDAGRPFDDTVDTPPSRFFVSLSVLTHTTKKLFLFFASFGFVLAAKNRSIHETPNGGTKRTQR
jgi:hypothetical protein